MMFVTLVEALSVSDVDKRFIMLTFITYHCFLLWDSFYLQQERKNKALCRVLWNSNTPLSLHYIFILFVTNTASIYVFIHKKLASSTLANHVY